MMGGKTGTPAETGLISLLALLADPEAYAAKLNELQATREAAEAAQIEAGRAMAAAAEQTVAAKELADAAEKASEKAAERMAVVEAARAELSLNEVANVELAKELAAKEDAQNEREAELAAKQDELDARDLALRTSEGSVVAMRQEYEAKVDKLRSVVA